MVGSRRVSEKLVLSEQPVYAGSARIVPNYNSGNWLILVKSFSEYEIKVLRSGGAIFFADEFGTLFSIDRKKSVKSASVMLELMEKAAEAGQDRRWASIVNRKAPFLTSNAAMQVAAPAFVDVYNALR